jgi:hypothetical protein
MGTDPESEKDRKLNAHDSRDGAIGWFHKTTTTTTTTTTMGKEK